MEKRAIVCSSAIAFILAVQGANAAPVAVRDAEMDRLLTQRLNRNLALEKRFDGQAKHVMGRARIDLSTCAFTVDLPASFIPNEDSEDFRDQLRGMESSLWSRARDLGCDGAGGSILFDGKSLEHYFPHDENEPAVSTVKATPTNEALTVVSAGHGLYYHHRYSDWRYQRDPTNSILEDELTPLLADDLQRFVRERSEHEVRRTRSSSGHVHEGSGQAWWKLAARYELKEKYPELPAIWNSLPNSTAGDRERKEDIRSRPLFANHLGAGGLIHVHTNAYEVDPSTRGARVYIHPKQMQNAPLARSMLCYMKELITAQPGYEGFPVALTPNTDDHGENRLANMPSVVVETAFHTNADDARALQDPVFRAAAMKGVEKGYRLHREGKGCTPLKLNPIADLAVPSWDSAEVELKFDGYPQYPVVATTTALSCPEGWECRDDKTTQGDPNWPVKLSLRCENSAAGRIVWQTELVDDDGVRAKPVTHAVDCGGSV